MPFNTRTGHFERIWQFVDQFEQGDDINRSDLDVMANDLAAGITEAAAQTLNYVGEWNPETASFPASRPSGGRIMARDAFVCLGDGTVGGIAFEAGETLVALVPDPGQVYAARWLKLPFLSLAAMMSIADAAQGFAEQAADQATASALSAAQAALYDGPRLDNMGEAIDYDTALTLTPGQPGTVEEGDVVQIRSPVAAMEVAASDAADADRETAGGVPLYVRRGVSGEVTPEMFGVRATGDSDDTEGWADLGEWCSTAGKGKRGFVLTARGRYNISGSDVLIDAAQDFVLDLTGARFEQQTDFSKTLRIDGSSRFRVMGGEFHGRGGAAGEFNGGSVSYNGVAGLFLHSCDRFSVTAMEMQDHAGGGIVYRECDKFSFRHNRVKGIGPDYINDNDNGQDFGIGGFSDDPDRMDFVGEFIGNDISRHAFGAFANRHKSLIFRGNHIHDIPGQHGLYTIESSGLVLTGNHFAGIYGQGAKMQLENYAGRGLAPSGMLNHKDILVSGNVFDDCQDAFAIISTSLSDPTDQLVHGVQIGPNVNRNMRQDGYILDRCVEYFIAPHVIEAPGRYGARLRNSSGRFEATVLRSGSNGISATLYGDSDFSRATLIDCGLTGSGLGNRPIYIDIPSNAPPSRDTTPTLTMDDVSIPFTGSDTANNVALIADANVALKLRRLKTNSAMSFSHAGSVMVSDGNEFAGFNSGGQNSPATFLPGRGRRVFHGQQNPQVAGSALAYRAGDYCLNTNLSVAANGLMLVGWVCTATGSPGTWTPCYIASAPALPGPYADDTAAASAGIAVGHSYRKTGGTLAWRVS